MRLCSWSSRFFLLSNTFISNTRPKFPKSQAKAKQHPKAELLISENYLFCSYTSKNNSKKYAKTSVSDIITLYDWLWWKWGWKRRIDQVDTI